MKQLFIFACCPLRYFSISMISMPLTMELVLAMAGTMLPAMFLTSLKDCCGMEKQNMRRLAALVMKWMISSSSFSKTTAPCSRLTADSLWKDSTKALMEVSNGCTLSCSLYPPSTFFPTFSTSNSSETLLIFLAKIWLNLLSVSDLAFRMSSISTWQIFLSMASQSFRAASSERSLRSLSQLSPLKRAQKSILAQTMQWMGFSGRMRMVQTGNTF